VGRSRASWIRVGWLLCVPVAAWLEGPLYVDAGGSNESTRPADAFFGVATLLGFALGVAMITERRGGSIVGTVALAALLATVASAFTDFFNPFVAPVYYGTIFGLPVAAGALLGAVGRSVRRRRSAKSIHR